MFHLVALVRPRCIALLICFIALAACSPPPQLAAPEGVSATSLETIGRLHGRILLKLAGVSAISVSHDVDCYRIVYRTHDGRGREIAASGLLALPRGVQARRLVSFQHGTSTSRDVAPSALDVSGKAAALVFAGNGYALVAPDYIGLGASEGVHPYLVAEDAARATTDLIAAARKLAGVPDGPVFLSGFSQGGQASMAALRALEAAGEQVLGAAPVAGPYDIRDISLGAALAGGAPSHALYLAYMSWGYAARYDRALDTVLTPAYAGIVDGLFKVKHDPQVIIETLPQDPREMFNRSFLDAFEGNGSHWLLEALAVSDVTTWKPRAPVRLYYGSNDVDVVPEEALAAERTLRERGADVRAIDVGPYAHEPSLLAAAPLILAWLRELDQASGAAKEE
jgi:pimeloyl-ACP methyl ester carboxylesterase